MSVPVDRLVLGCAPLGNLYTPVADDTAEATVEAAWQAGIRSFDTAPLYGHGLSETRLGRALAGRTRSEFSVSTKVGRRLVPGVDADTIFSDTPALRPVFDFSADAVVASVESSLDRLGLDHIDTVLLHDPDDHLDRAITDALPALRRLADDGVVGSIGVGTNTPWVAAHVIAEATVDCVLLAGRITLLDRSGVDAVLPVAAAAGVEVMAAGVFNGGVLADPRPGSCFDYAPASADVIDTARRHHGLCADRGVSPIAAAVQFPFRFPAVSSVVVGARSPDEVTADVTAATAAVPDDLWPELAAVHL